MLIDTIKKNVVALSTGNYGKVMSTDTRTVRGSKAVRAMLKAAKSDDVQTVRAMLMNPTVPEYAKYEFLAKVAQS